MSQDFFDPKDPNYDFLTELILFIIIGGNAAIAKSAANAVFG